MENYRQGWEIIPDQNRRDNYLDRHTENFVAAINAHMGNVAFKTGRKVYWDAEKKLFKEDNEANKLLSPNYHNGWVLPKN